MIGIVFLSLAVIGLFVAIGGLVFSLRSETSGDGATGCIVVGGIMFVLFGLFFLTRNFTTVDAGEVKVQVMFGKVLDTVLTEGFSSKSPFASTDTYNVQLRETSMDIKDGNYLQALTADKLAVKIDATIWWKIVKTDVKMIRREISSNEDDIDEMITFPAIRSAVRDAAVFYTFEEITSVKGRTELTQKIDDILIRLTKDKGVVIDAVLIRNVVPEDQRVTNAIGMKLEQQQQLQAKEYELLKSGKDAEIRIQNAKGIAEAQHIIDKTLTPEYLKFEEIQMMKALGHSPSNTFVFYEKAPTGQKSIGDKMVYTLGDFEKKKK